MSNPHSPNSPPTNGLDACRSKMLAAGVSEVAVRAFEFSYRALASGAEMMVPEASIRPVESLPLLEELAAGVGGGAGDSGGLLEKAVVIKLNGGLGTGMGLQKAKSLLEVREGMTFLDLTARQILALRGRFGMRLRFLLMNSFSTSVDTLAFLARYPELGGGAELEFLQSQAPKLDAVTLEPVEWPADPALEWCPPGHGDLYPALLASGQLESLLTAGVRYAFVSNSDNLGATLDLALLRHFAASDQPFLMEVTRRTEADRKGIPPVVKLDAAHYKLVDQLEAAIPDGAPGLRACERLEVSGPVRFAAGVRFTGAATVRNPSEETRVLTAGEYSGEVVV